MITLLFIDILERRVTLENNKKNFKFIDLFSGIGGFHQAAASLGGECVYASEIDKYCIETYKENYGLDSNNDITKVDISQIPKFDVLLGGFPCQAFSKAGNQQGFLDKTRGTLFFNVARIIEYHRPKYVLLENVRNLVTHDNGNTWDTIVATLEELGYTTLNPPLILSPHNFGIPQLRERVFIPAVYDPDNKIKLDIDFNKLLKKTDNNIKNILEKNVSKDYCISDEHIYALKAWDNFKLNIEYKTLGFPIWADVFLGAKKYDTSNAMWKNNFIKKNLELYNMNKTFIDSWLLKYNIESFPKGLRKFEWQAGNDYESLFDCLVQLRPSGVRVKRPDVSPALVAMVQVPIFAPEKRYLSVRECGNLQSFPKDFIFNENKNQAYKQLGNAVNVKVANKVLEKLLKY